MTRLLGMDLGMLLLFVFLGQREHETLDGLRLLLNVGVFALPYLAAGAWLGAFPRGGAGLRTTLERALAAWLAAAPLGILLRAALLGRAVIPAPFLAVTLGLGAAFLLAGRLLLGLLGRRARPA